MNARKPFKSSRPERDVTRPTVSHKAVAVSAASHALLLFCFIQLNQWRPETRSYPRTITAVLVPKGVPEKAGSSPTPAKAVVPPAASPAAQPQKPNVSTPATVAKGRTEKKTPPPAPKKSAQAAKKGAEAEKPSRTQDSATTPSAAATGQGQSGAASSAGVKVQAGGVARIDGPEFPFPHYLALLQFRIENQWQPPYLGAGQYLATIHFIIAASGRIVSVELESSSGNFAFDQAAMRAVHNANPLPALPEGAGLDKLGVHFDFVANW